MERMSCLIIILDGCREDYISQEMTPFLSHLKSLGSYTKLDVSSSFYTPAEIFTGNSPITTDTLFDFCFDPEGSPFKFCRLIKLPMNLRRGNAKREKILNRLMINVNLLLTRNWVDFPPNLPVPLLPYFSVNPSQVRFHKSEREQSTEHLFGILKENGFSFERVSGHASSIMERMRGRTVSETDVLLLHYQELDKLGHEYGPTSAVVEKALKQIDASIEEIYGVLREGIDFVMVFGDHGMEPVEQNIDLWSELKKLSVKIPRDYLVFLNSPVARFWFRNDKAREEVREFLHSWGKYGREVPKDELRERGIPSHEKYGEIIFWLKNGVVINPDFYHETLIKGMHFYLDSPESTALILFHREKKVKLSHEGRLRDVMPTILELLDIGGSVNRDGKSLVLGETQ